MPGASALRRAFVSLAEFKRIVRGMGFARARHLQEWLRSPECPSGLPKSPHTVYAKDGWVSYLEALDLPRTQHEAIGATALARILADPNRSLSRNYGKNARADVAITWAQRLLAECGYETKRLPRQLQGSLLLREKNGSSDVTEEQHSSSSTGRNWWALQVRSIHSTESRTTSLAFAHNDITADVAILVANPEAQRVKIFDLASVKVRQVRPPSGRVRCCISMPDLSCIKEEQEHIAFQEALRETLKRLPAKSQRSWLTDLPGSAGAVRCQKLYLQLWEKVLVPSGFSGNEESSLPLAEGSLFVIAGRRCRVHSCLVTKESKKCPNLNFKRVRVVNGRRVVLPLGLLDDAEFVLALMYDDSAALFGVFVFPRPWLIKWGGCKETLTGGQTAMVVYPPGRDHFRPARRAQVDEQRQFYLDLSTEILQGEAEKETDEEIFNTSCASPSVIAKFRSIILGNHEIIQKSNEIQDESESLESAKAEGPAP
ncbi:unnamed protein product [Amoebophrya sp. A25]|nr:unnamed protein product [Amoebophrya sp. A25]|eukprot:GSA25T00015379001.1